MQHSGRWWISAAGALLAALALVVMSAAALAQNRSGAAPVGTVQQHQYQYAPPSPQAVRVPQLVGLTLADAEHDLQQAHLVLILPSTVATPSLAARIASQQPAAGTVVAPGSRVSVALALPAPKPIAAPNLVGHTVAEAQAIVARMAFRLAVRNPTGAGDGARIDRQEPLAGSPLRPRAMIAVWVAPPPVVVPKVVGLAVARAQLVVREANLRLSVPEADLATVIATQSPAAGTRVPAQTVVTVTLAPPLVVVPDIVRQRLADGRRLVARANLRLALPGDPRTASDDALIVGQDPPAGRRVPVRTVVAVKIAAPPPPVQTAPSPSPPPPVANPVPVSPAPPPAALVPPRVPAAPPPSPIPVSPPAPTAAAPSPPPPTPPAIPAAPVTATQPALPSSPAAVVPDAPHPPPIWQPVAAGVAGLLLLGLLAETAKRLWRRHYRPRPVRIALVRDTGRQRLVVRGPLPVAPIVSVRLRRPPATTTLRRVA